MVDRVAMLADAGAGLLRVGWFLGVNWLVDREYVQRGARTTHRPTRPTPTRGDLLRDLRQLIETDAANVRDGLYPPIEMRPGKLAEHFARLRAMMGDLPDAIERRKASETLSVRDAPGAEDLPDYFTQDFHFQSGGYLTEDSARLYDVQVETLFYGSGVLMRRAALAAVCRAVGGRDQRTLQLLDVACGTGRFLREVRRALPAIRLTGVDLSAAYLEEARRHLRGVRGATWAVANAEALPFADASQDIVTCIFLFHELPPDVRRKVASELSRVLKPGGTFVFVDSLQMGDKPDWDGLLEMFPIRFHEPYYRQYAIDDLDQLFNDAGLPAHDENLAFLSKVMVRRKPQ